jgi:hypothetical protein
LWSTPLAINGGVATPTGWEATQAAGSSEYRTYCCRYRLRIIFKGQYFHSIGLQPLLWIRNYFLYPDPDPILLRVLDPDSTVLDMLKVPNPPLRIHSFTMRTILKVFSWHFKAAFSV